MELLLTAFVVGFIIYLRFYAQFLTNTDKDLERFQPGITLLAEGKPTEALSYFCEAIQRNPRSGVAYLYRARCYSALGNRSAAMADLELGKQYDDTIPDIHLDSGQIHFQRREYAAAFLDFDKAVFHSRSNDSQAYYWRGLTRQQLQQATEAEQDFIKAIALAQAADNKKQSSAAIHRVSYTKRVAEVVLTVISSVALVYAIKFSPTIHGPFLLAATSAALLGFAEPRKGWLLALVQVILVSLAYVFFIRPTETKAVSELHLFSFYGSSILILVSSFITGLLKRQLTPYSTAN